MPDNPVHPDRYYLHGIRSRDHRLKPGDPGKLTSGKNFLGDYENEIELGHQLPDPHSIHSVPSVYARPIQFYQAIHSILTPSHLNPLHDQTVAEWRGLLALFGLAAHMGWSSSLRFEKVTVAIPQAGNAPQSDRSPASANLYIGLEGQMPFPKDEWRSWWIITFDNQLVGATSPWSVVFTPADYECPDRIPWRDKSNRLIDPTVYYKERLNSQGYSQDLTILYKWINRLASSETSPAERWGYPKDLETSAQAVAKELTIWESELKQYAEPGLDTQWGLDRDFANLNRRPYRSFLNHAVPHITSRKRADGTSDGLKSVEWGLRSDYLVLDKEGKPLLMLPAEGANPTYRVWDSLYGAQTDVSKVAMNEGVKGEWLLEGMNIQVAMVKVENLFFPSKLAELASRTEENAYGGLSDRAWQPECLGSHLNHLAVPLTSTFFKYFTMEDLYSGRVQVILSENGPNITATLRIGSLSGRPLEFSKVYSSNQIISANKARGKTEAIFSLWPDKVSDSWKNYKAYTYMVSGSKLKIAPLLAGKGSPLSVEAGIRGVQYDYEVMIWNLDRIPIGFSLKVVEGLTEIECGAILRADMQKPLAVRKGEKWIVAVDFGTSNTNVWFQASDDSEAKPLPFGVHVMTLTRGRDEPLATMDEEFEIMKAMTANSFPTLPWNLPPFVHFPTSGAAYLVNSHYWRDANTVIDNLGGYIRNLKWAQRGEDVGERPLAGYLRSLMNIILCEAWLSGVTKLDLRWAYPQSLPSRLLDTMKSFWMAKGKELAGGSGIDVTAAKGALESDVACRTMAAFKVLVPRAEALSIAIDIGGGSSDFAFWRKGELADVASFKLAANDIVVPLIEKSDRIAEDIVRICTKGRYEFDQETINRLKAKMRGKGAAIPGNFLLSLPFKYDVPFYAHPLSQYIFGEVKQETPHWLTARSAAFIFFTGLCFYAGLQARRHLKDIEYKEIHLFFGGRGSMLLSWISQDHELINLRLAKAVEEAARIDAPPGLPLKVVVRSHFTERLGLQPKAEVVNGLFIKELAVAKNFPSPDTTIIGERLWMREDGANRKPVEWDEYVGNSIIPKLSPPGSFDSCYVASLLPLFAELALNLNLDDEALEEFSHGAAIDRALIQEAFLAAASSSEAVLQPVFGYELKQIIDQYLSKRKDALAK